MHLWARLVAFFVFCISLAVPRAFAGLDDMRLYQGQYVDVYARDFEILTSSDGPLVSFTVEAEGKNGFLPGSFDGVMLSGGIDTAGGIICDPYHADYNSRFLYDADEALVLDCDRIPGYQADPKALTGIFSLFIARQTLPIARIYTGVSINVDMSFTIGSPGSELTEHVQAGFMPLWAGDADLDGDVDMYDFLILKSNYGSENCGWTEGDFNGDGKVTIMDFLLLKSNYMSD